MKWNEHSSSSLAHYPHLLPLDQHFPPQHLLGTHAPLHDYGWEGKSPEVEGWEFLPFPNIRTKKILLCRFEELEDLHIDNMHHYIHLIGMHFIEEHGVGRVEDPMRCIFDHTRKLPPSVACSSFEIGALGLGKEAIIPATTQEDFWTAPPRRSLVSLYRTVTSAATSLLATSASAFHDVGIVLVPSMSGLECSSRVCHRPSISVAVCLCPSVAVTSARPVILVPSPFTSTPSCQR
ncbi:hypothetical protein PIB30_093549 [Stylosanthes scabra]|uniref:Uncharacterized protein n=1 Tax=Stylosanthes scabra TaxID=79078 RepID=A0ABU6XVW8_9FABA|nr:hypothetical protein [Stylosanthes scabra]